MGELIRERASEREEELLETSQTSMGIGIGELKNLPRIRNFLFIRLFHFTTSDLLLTLFCGQRPRPHSVAPKNAQKDLQLQM
jgi:hypothetical protein